eukprot:TRINITY_DN4897_c0_g1_i1.p1 TRINITY_DN4897_c0_g1~~TRINITY_DN4897_c0_g1_i1.p1  ORF type:complete len:285 (-),score=32.94 TRINITY_DN4897_c0_g1_i1:51-854(-)
MSADPRSNLVNMHKANSTSSLFLDKLIPHSADSSILIKCLSRVVHQQVLYHHKVKPTPDIWNEKLHPLGYESQFINFDVPPSMRHIEQLLVRIFTNQILSAECAVMATAYIDRISRRKVKLCPSNWRRILLGALLLSEKVWEDQAVWNVDYAKSFPDISVEDLRYLEREFLIKIQFELTLRPSEYAKYYFGLVALRERTAENYPVKPLDKKTAQNLEAKSKGIAEVAKMEIIHDRPYKSYNYAAPHSNASVSLEQLQRIRVDVNKFT